MQIRSFLLTSALYLSLAGSALPAAADEQRPDTRDNEGRATCSVGNDEPESLRCGQDRLQRASPGDTEER